MIEFIVFDKDNRTHREIFLKLLIDYFAELFADEPENMVPDDRMPEVMDDFISEMSNNLFWIYLCYADNEIIGFTNFQIDTENKPWCKKPGWGFIREVYIIPSQRKKGYARQMCLFMENVFSENNAAKIYLTSGEKNVFWEKMGYRDSGIIDDFMGQNVYVKEN